MKTNNGRNGMERESGHVGREREMGKLREREKKEENKVRSYINSGERERERAEQEKSHDYLKRDYPKAIVL